MGELETISQSERGLQPARGLKRLGGWGLAAAGTLGTAAGNYQKIIDVLRRLREVNVNLGTVVFDVVFPLIAIGGVLWALYGHFVRRAFASDKVIEKKIDALAVTQRETQGQIGMLVEHRTAINSYTNGLASRLDHLDLVATHQAGLLGELRAELGPSPLPRTEEKK
jgi:hypothetical protein